MKQKKIYRLNLTIALEANSSDDAYQLLLSDDMMNQIKAIIKESKGVITEVMDKDELKKPLIC